MWQAKVRMACSAHRHIGQPGGKNWGVDNHLIFATILVTMPVTIPELLQNPVLNN